MHTALSIICLRVISPNPRIQPQCSAHRALALERGGGQDPPSTAQTWREPPILMAVIGIPWACLITVFFQGYCFEGGGSCLESCSLFLWTSWKGLPAFVSHGPMMGVSAQLDWHFPAGWRALGQPCCGSHVLPCANWHCWECLHLRHALLSLWISNYGKKRLLKSCFENVFQILSFSNYKHC